MPSQMLHVSGNTTDSSINDELELTIIFRNYDDKKFIQNII